jgi:hypothetical protein
VETRLLLGRTKIESIIRHLGIKMHDAMWHHECCVAIAPSARCLCRGTLEHGQDDRPETTAPAVAVGNKRTTPRGSASTNAWRDCVAELAPARCARSRKVVAAPRSSGCRALPLWRGPPVRSRPPRHSRQRRHDGGNPAKPMCSQSARASTTVSSTCSVRPSASLDVGCGGDVTEAEGMGLASPGSEPARECEGLPGVATRCRGRSQLLRLAGGHAERPARRADGFCVRSS